MIKMPRCYMVKKALCNKYISNVARGFESWGRGRSTPSPATMQIPVSPIEGSIAPPVAQGTTYHDFMAIPFFAYDPRDWVIKWSGWILYDGGDKRWDV